MMTNIINPEEFGLPRKTLIEEVGKHHLAIVINRKSRVIMSDGKKILEKAEKIRKLQPNIIVSLRISAPLCRKTRTFLEEHGIDVV
jgi:hypothetical protein